MIHIHVYTYICVSMLTDTVAGFSEEKFVHAQSEAAATVYTCSKFCI